MPRVKVLVGTRKGGFIYTSDGRRRTWDLSEPILPGWSFYHMAGDARSDPPRLYAAANHWAWGRAVAKSTDLGKTWDFRSEGLAFPPDLKGSEPLAPNVPGEWANTPPGRIANVWHVAPGHPSEPGVVYAGTQPAGLFRSEDWGHSWEPVDSMNRHPYRKYWTGTGGGDSCLHSIHVDPRDARHVYLSVGAGGSYQSRDGGETWELFCHNAVPTDPRAVALIQQFIVEGVPAGVDRGPWDRDPAGLNELHHMRVDPKNPDRIWGQAHWGVFRSDDSGTTWQDVTAGLPSFHGFPIAVTRRGLDAVYVVPLDYGQDNFRVCPGQLAVYRTRDAGRSWEALTKGLPGPYDFQSVYREGLDTDDLEPAGVYLGTSNGHVYASADLGESWTKLPGTLPPILSVTAFTLP
jgi:photosystem II stability/assembly factor-like uncharacterized protein